MDSERSTSEPETDGRLSGVRLAAHLLLGGAVVLYVYATRLALGNPWRDLLLAFSEAAMVGGLADWFAVTALFRRPLGLPFPHTAIIPSNKDRIGQNFGRFIQRNFLSPEILERKIDRADFAKLVFSWLERDEHSREVVLKTAAVLGPVLETISHERIHEVLLRGLRKALGGVELAPYIGRTLQFVFGGTRARAVTDELFSMVGQLVDENKTVIRKKVRETTPWFVPDFIDNKIYEKIILELKQFFGAVVRDENHPFRAKFAEKIGEFARKLESDPSYRELGEIVKNEVLSSENLRSILGGCLREMKSALAARLASENDPVTGMFANILSDMAREICANDALRYDVNRWIRAGILSANSLYSAKVAQFITDTVKTWDTSTLVDKFELEIGRDLQFIRVNGTLVGGFIGLVIYLIKINLQP